MTADDEGDDSSRLLSRQGPDLQDGGASSETRDHIFASGGRKSGFVAASRAGRRTSLKGTARRRRHFAPLPFTTALPMVFAGREGVGSTAVPRGCCKRWLGAPISAAPGREPRRGSRCGGAIAARRRVGSRAAPSDPARQRPASVPDAAPTLRGASAIWGKQLVRRFLHSSTSRRRELCWNLVGWREGGESPMCQPKLLLFVTVVTVVQRPASRKWQKTRVKPENTWDFPGIFGYYPHWTLEIVVGHCQAFLIVVQPA